MRRHRRRCLLFNLKNENMFYVFDIMRHSKCHKSVSHLDRLNPEASKTEGIRCWCTFRVKFVISGIHHLALNCKKSKNESHLFDLKFDVNEFFYVVFRQITLLHTSNRPTFFSFYEKSNFELPGS